MLISEELGNLVVVDGPCIISVDTVNKPTGLWWGTIKTKEKKEDRYNVTACISGGKFQFQKGYSSYVDINQPIYSDQFKDCFPIINYTIYPDLHFIRSILSHQETLEKSLHNAKLNFGSEKKLLLDVIANLKMRASQESDEG